MLSSTYTFVRHPAHLQCLLWALQKKHGNIHIFQLVPTAGVLRKRGFSSTFIRWFRESMIESGLQMA